MQARWWGTKPAAAASALVVGTLLPVLAALLAHHHPGIRTALRPQILVPSQPAPAGIPSPAAEERLPTRAEIKHAAATHWAFQALRPVDPPAVSDPAWARTPIDRFVLSRLELQGLRPAPQISRRRLIRRAYFDLLGLPPSPEEIEAFVQDASTDAYPRLIDRLLASPHYGERWGRHWLDLARYADSSGYEADRDRPGAYPYRDFVIRALNDDMPYDRFVRHQIAGDEYRPDDSRAAAATGFCTSAPTVMPGHSAKDRWDELDDQVSTTASAFLGLTVGCARCHDHKYDPISQQDYYRIAGIFSGAHRANRFLDPAEGAAYQRATSQWKQRLTAVRSELTAWLAEKKAVASATSPTPVTERELRRHLPMADKRHWAQLEDRARAVQDEKPSQPPVVLSLAGDRWAPAHVREHGNPDQIGPATGTGLLTLFGGTSAPWSRPYGESRSAGLLDRPRVRLAEWLTDVDHGAGALAARVIVNRVWQHHFGQGLVRTPGDFGLRGDRPTNAALLEWLAATFVTGAEESRSAPASGIRSTKTRPAIGRPGGHPAPDARTPYPGMGWSLKRLHRLIMLSAVYMEGTRWDGAAAKVDPDDRLLWRRAPKRLEAEALRDSMLTVSGCLNPQMYGPGIHPWIDPGAIYQTEEKYGELWPSNVADGPATWRRTIYVFVKRSNPLPLVQAFDGPDGVTGCPQRSDTTVAPQALYLLNDRFVRDQAAHFAERVSREAGSDRAAQVERAYRIAVGRVPHPTELDASLAFLRHPRAASRAIKGQTDPALVDFCQVLLSTNEFTYVD